MDSATSVFAPQLDELLSAAAESQAKHADQFETAFRAMTTWLSQKPTSHPQAREAIAKLGGLCLRMLATMPVPEPAAPAAAPASAPQPTAKAKSPKEPLATRAQKDDLTWLVTQMGLLGIDKRDRTLALLNINVWARTKVAAEIERFRGLILAKDPGFVFPPLLPGTERQQVADACEAYYRQHMDMLGEAAYQDVYHMVQGRTVTTEQLRRKLEEGEAWVEQQQAA